MKRTHLYLALGAAAVVGFGVLYLLRPNVRPSHGVRIVYSLDVSRAIEQRTAELGRPLTPAEADAVQTSSLQQAIVVLRDRIDQRGVDSPSVIQRGDQIVVELPGFDDEMAAPVRSLVGRTAKLEFSLVANNNEVTRGLFAHVGMNDAPVDAAAVALGIEAQTEAWSHDASGERFDYYLTARDRREELPLAEARALGCIGRAPSPAPTVICPVSGRQVLERYLAVVRTQDSGLQPAAGFRFGYERVEPPPDAVDQQPYWRTYYLEGVALDNRAVAGAEVVYSAHPSQPEVQIELSRSGAQTFGELTAAHLGRKLAVLVDDRVIMAPIIQAPILGGRIIVTLGAGTADQQAAEADALVSALRAGSLPAPLREESFSRWGTPPADP